MTQESFPTTMTIEKISDVEGNNGPQWELQVKWPWTNNYPDKIWLDKAAFEKPENKSHNVLVNKAGYKKKQDGTYYDGDLGWMFNYRLDSFGGDGHQAAPKGHTGAAGDRGDIFRTKEELRWTEALHMASRLAASSPANLLLDHTLDMGEQLYQALEAGYPHLESAQPPTTAPEHFCQKHQEPHI